jgi:hypothetical protein
MKIARKNYVVNFQFYLGPSGTDAMQFVVFPHLLFFKAKKYFMELHVLLLCNCKLHRQFIHYLIIPYIALAFLCM